MDYGAAGCGEAAVPGGDAPDLLQPAEHLLDGIGQRRGVGRGSSCGVGLPWAGCVLQPPSVLGTAPGALIAPWAWPIRIEGAISDRQHAFGNGLDQHLAAVEAGCCLVARGDETRSACRPRSPPRGSRSSAHHPIAAGRDGFPVRPMACASPPFSARGYGAPSHRSHPASRPLGAAQPWRARGPGAAARPWRPSAQRGCTASSAGFTRAAHTAKGGPTAAHARYR